MERSVAVVGSQARQECTMKSCLLLLAGLAAVSAIDNGLGLTPRLAWSSWNFFGLYAEEVAIREVEPLARFVKSLIVVVVED